MKIKELHGYEVRSARDRESPCKWYKRIVAKGYPEASWRYATINADILDTKAWVFRHGTWWKWRIKKLDWFDEGMEKTLTKAMRAVEKNVSCEEKD